ncbi:MAG: efflux RND transporter periplasmic adaptor subunit [Acidaminococcaceae bacterium]|nr:efflux RND transporter periplasmic adaptor subunit [Acidaminococcaceae bacterium]
MKFIKNNLYALLFLVILIGACFGGYKYYQNQKAAKTETVKTASVEYGNLQKSVSATGSLTALDNVDISSKITGRIVEVFVEENDHVKAGQLLLRLDDSSLKATEEQREATLNEAALTLERYRRLVEKGAIAQQAYDTALMNYRVAKAAHEQAVSNTNDTYIYSPIDGYVIGKPTPVGQTISSGISSPQVIMSIANLDKMQIETLVDESDIGQIKVGQKVEFTVDSYPEETFEGIVRLISRSATTTNNVVYYKVYVDVANSKNKLFPTMTARTNIIISEAGNVLMVPQNCIFFDGGRKYVKKYDPQTKQETEIDVEVGMSGDESIAVKSDQLRQGDKLVVKTLKAKQNNNNMRGGPGGAPRI